MIGTNLNGFEELDPIDEDNLWQGKNNKVNLQHLKIRLFSDFYTAFNEPEIDDKSWHVIWLNNGETYATSTNSPQQIASDNG